MAHGVAVSDVVRVDMPDCAPSPHATAAGVGSVETEDVVDPRRQRFPFCVVWTPIPLLTWLLPFIGHMGIATSTGVIRDFAGPYFVSEDSMAFGRPTRYWRLLPQRAVGGRRGWDAAVSSASSVYQHRMHNLLCDNCHSHVALALNKMQYDGHSSWNMFRLAATMLVRGRHVSVAGVVLTWAPFLLWTTTLLLLSLLH